jgi:hypothetical protein
MRRVGSVEGQDRYAKGGGRGASSASRHEPATNGTGNVDDPRWSCRCFISSVRLLPDGVVGRARKALLTGTDRIG